MGTITCACRKLIFDGVVLKMRVGQFRDGFMNIKCPRCKAYLNGLPIGILSGEVDIDLDYKEYRRRVKHEQRKTHQEHSQGDGEGDGGDGSSSFS